MPITKAQEKTLSEMVGLERAIRDLYKLYSEIIPRKREFWIGLANEENEHANWIVALKGQIQTGCVDCAENRFNSYGVEKAIEYVKQQTILSGKINLDFSKALATALNIEKMLLEKKFYECFESDCPEIKKILRNLKQETENHSDRIRQAWEQQSH